MSYTAEEWARWKRAVFEYSNIRPRLIYQIDWAPTADVKAQSFPSSDIIGVERMNYGAQESLYVVLSDEAANQGWAEERGQLALTPAPPADTTVLVVWRAEHQPDEDTQTFPTMPKADQPVVDKLYAAMLLEEDAENILRGPIKYTIGQKSVSRETAADGLLRRARDLRNEVMLQLASPAADWA
jgi:hypothetical protein